MTTIYPITTVGALKEILKNLPDDVEIDSYGTGSTGYIDGPLELEVSIWEHSKPDICINVKAESSFHY